MSKHPKLSLILDVEKDIENALGFLEYEKNEWFLDRFFGDDAKYIIESGFTKEVQQSEVRRYTEEAYRKQYDELVNGIELIGTEWGRVRDEYFELVDTIFKGRPWPKGNYSGVLSIFGMFPRWIDRKTFFFPYDHLKPHLSKRVIAHEMLHFMFFDHISERYGLEERSSVDGKESDYVWKVSEVFNVVIENWAPYRAIMPEATSAPYPGQEEMFTKMSEQWGECQDIDWLLDLWFEKRK